MGHTKPSLLEDLEQELAAIHQLTGVKQKKTGIFYYKSTPLLHFHDSEGRRLADIKTLEGWHRVEIKFGATQKEKTAFLERVFTAYMELSAVRRRPEK